MFTDLLRRLSGKDAGPLPPDDARVAIAALLTTIAQADRSYDDVERAQIERVLMARYGLSSAAAAQLRAEGEAADIAAIDIYRFTALIKERVPLEERTGVIEALWRVVLADGVRDDHEDHLMRRIADLLGVDPRDSVLARQRVQAGS